MREGGHMVTMEDTRGREYEINPDGVEALEALGWKRLDAAAAAPAETDEATASDDGDADGTETDEATASDDGDADGTETDEATASDDAAPAAPRRGRPRKK